MNKPSRLKSFEVDSEKNDVLEKINEFARDSNYRIDDIDQNEGIIVLSDESSFWSDGYIYPIYIGQNEEGALYVEVGIKSKNPVQISGFKKPHKRCFNEVKSIFSSNLL